MCGCEMSFLNLQIPGPGGEGGGERCDISSFTLFTFLFHKFYGEGGGDANPLSLHSRSALDSDESLND